MGRKDVVLGQRSHRVQAPQASCAALGRSLRQQIAAAIAYERKRRLPVIDSRSTAARAQHSGKMLQVVQLAVLQRRLHHQHELVLAAAVLTSTRLRNSSGGGA